VLHFALQKSIFYKELGMNITQFTNWLPLLIEGLEVTISASLISMFTAVIFGCLLASLLSFDNKILTPVLRIHISVFRNSPLLVQMFFIFYGLPYAGITLSPLLSGILAITLNESAFIAEIIRGSIKNIPVGEIEEAYSLGLSKFQVIAKVTFPLAFRTSIPMLTGQSSIIIKDTSLLSLIMIIDITRAGNMYYSMTFNNISIWIVAGIYIVLFLFVSNSGRYFEKKVMVQR